MFGITSHDLFLVGVLVFLEGILSVDNALVLALMARHLPTHQQKKALTYGLAGAFIFRFIALALVTFLVKWTWVKFLGGAYLIWIAGKHLLTPAAKEGETPKVNTDSFWKTVILIELMDIAFAVDSILAAVALTNKLWVIYTGGMLGIVLMRFAATAFIRLIEKFPRLESTAYLLVLIIGFKVIIEAFHFPGVDFHSPKAWTFWAFWSLMGICVAFGFVKTKPTSASGSNPSPKA